MPDRFLFTKIDNSPLIIFRIFFGMLVALECYGAILTGWVRRTLVAPKFTFNCIGFEWLQPLPGYGMYFYFFIMGTLGILIALGYKYRFAIISFTLMWAGVYLMQKTFYNNHYYLLVLISGLMCFFPAHRSHSFGNHRSRRPYHQKTKAAHCGLSRFHLAVRPASEKRVCGKGRPYLCVCCQFKGKHQRQAFARLYRPLNRSGEREMGLFLA